MKAITEADCTENGTLPLPGAEIRYLPNFLSRQESDTLYQALMKLEWLQFSVKIMGKTIPSPRLSAWYGDAGITYRYSGVTYEANGWPAELGSVKRAIERAVGQPFNSALANLYRDGQDSMGWHSDDEPELGAKPLIASLSLGGVRRFTLRAKGPKDGPRAALSLASGSLLLMGGDTMATYRHALPKTRRDVPPRINLTFRAITPSAGR